MGKQSRFLLQENGERSMLTTWKISYEQVLRQSEAAAWLLRLWAFFHHDDVWHGLLAAGVELTSTTATPKWLAELAGSELEFSDAMGLLTAYSLADSLGAGSYSMHSVLHRWSRSLSLDSEAASLRYISVCTLGKLAPSEEDEEYWKLDRRLLQHALHSSDELLVSQVMARQEFPPWTMHYIGDLLQRQGKLDEAKLMYKRALAGYEKALGPDHTSTLGAVNNLGLLCSNQGKLDEAELMYKRALTGYEKALGPDHTSTLDTVNNLGLLYSDQGKLDEAELMYKRALAGYEKALGPDHMSTLGAVNNLGLLYRAQGKLDEAELMYKRALAGKEEALGPDHTSTLGAVNNLGLLYCAQGKLDEAELMYKRALASYEMALGPDHTSTLVIVNNLGNLYRAQGKLDEAELMYKRALAGYEKALGPDHMSTLGTVNNLGLLYSDQGKLDEAELMYKRALLSYQRIYGPSHERVTAASEKLASTRLEKGKLLYLLLYHLDISANNIRKPLKTWSHHLLHYLDLLSMPSLVLRPDGGRGGKAWFDPCLSDSSASNVLR
jgi:tetratricopeptide (TPR) repeat protein